MKRSVRLALAGAAVGALTMTAAAPGSAQEPLGLEIDPTEGLPGDLVAGQVDVDDVAANCNTDVGELQARFAETEQALQGLADVFMPGFDFEDPAGTIEFFVLNDFEQVTWFAMFVLAGQVGSSPALAEEALPQTFVMTFADIATQDPVGQLVNFDPAIGAATLTVPDVVPGLWAVAAACLSPSTDRGVLQDAVSTNAPLVEEFLTGGGFEDVTGEPFPGLPIADPPVAFDISAITALQIGDTLVPATVEPDALGAQLFTVLADPRDLVADVIADIDRLFAEGKLRLGQARGLIQPLENAIRSLDRDEIERACSLLGDKVANIEGLATGNALDPEAAEDLIAQISAIEAQLGCT